MIEGRSFVVPVTGHHARKGKVTMFEKMNEALTNIESGAESVELVRSQVVVCDYPKDRRGSQCTPS